MKLVRLGLATLLASPALAQTSQLTGTIAGLGSKPLLYCYERQGKRLADTVHVRDGGILRTELPLATTVWAHSTWQEPRAMSCSGLSQALCAYRAMPRSSVKFG